jgi:hypothetical protein
MIADEVVKSAEFQASIGPVLEGACFAFATKVTRDMDRRSRPWRRLIRFSNHAYLLRVAGPAVGRQVYEHVEDLLHWDYHYWLQRGSLEVEEGDLGLATNFLDQAVSLEPDDRNVETEYAYLLMKRAATTASHPEAPEWFSKGWDYLEAQITNHGKHDSYPFHVLGSQGLAWVRRGGIPMEEKRRLLQTLFERLRSGTAMHPFDERLPGLLTEVQQELLSTVVSADQPRP